MLHVIYVQYFPTVHTDAFLPDVLMPYMSYVVHMYSVYLCTYLEHMYHNFHVIIWYSQANLLYIFLHLCITCYYMFSSILYMCT